MASYRYIAFDVETPNRYNDRMSAIGITVVEDGRIVGEHYTPVNPETFFDDFNTRLTGLDQDAVRGAPTFPELWQQIAPVFESGLLVAHNAVFDLGVLKKCLRDYEIPWRRYARYLCTVQMGRRLLPGIGHRLNEMCCYYNIPPVPSSRRQRQPRLRRDPAALFPLRRGPEAVHPDLFPDMTMHNPKPPALPNGAPRAF